MDPKKQFDNQARFYAESTLFSSGLSLKLLINLIDKKKFKKALDIGTGTGFTALEISKNTNDVIGIDISEGMLNEANIIKKNRGIYNVNFEIGKAEKLKYKDDSFDLITCRTAAHHFSNIEKSLSEIKRTMTQEGICILIDTISSDQSELNLWHQKVEKLRDASHVKNYSLIEWRSLLKDAGLVIKNTYQTRVNMDIESWMERSGTSQDTKKVLRDLFLNADNKTTDFFGLKQTKKSIDFFWPVGIFEIKNIN